MKKIALYLIFALTSVNVHSQTFEWIQSQPLNFSFNPSYPSFPVTYDQTNDRIIHARLDSFAYIYSVSVLGKNQIESRDTNGLVLWQYPIGNAVCIQRIAVDQPGNILVAGQFRETLRFGNNDSLEFLNVGFTGWNFFLLKLDNQGNLLWKRNLSATWPFYDGIEALSVDPSGNFWYAITDFFVAKIVSINNNGNDVIVHTIENGKTIGNICFDPSGGMYVSGGAEGGNFVMNADTFFAASAYNFFIARFNPQQQPSWAYFGHDITFQRPMITNDPAGNVFLAGMRYDSTSFNGVFLPPPLPFGDFFAMKVDSAGTVLWVVKQPPLLIGPFGNFTTGSNLNVASDAQGNFYLGGIQQGFVDWGNGYTSSTSGFSDHKFAIAFISPGGSTQWVKLGGSEQTNFMHALTVSDESSCYFTGSFSDTATFDNIIIPNNNFYNFALGKIRVLPTALSDYPDEMAVELYPNPASDILFFRGVDENTQITLFDMTGRLVFERARSTSNSLDVSSLAPGCYTIRFSDENSYRNARFVKAN